VSDVTISLSGETLTLSFQPTPVLLAKVRALPSRRFDPKTCTWQAPHNAETWEALRSAGFDVSTLPRPTASGYLIDAKDERVKILVPYSPINSEICRRIPDKRMWDDTRKAWYCKATSRNLAYLRAKFPAASWTGPAQALYERMVVVTSKNAATIAQQKVELGADDKCEVHDYKFGGPSPYLHQRRVFLISRDLPAFAYLMEQRTGKSKPLIDTATWLYLRDQIDAVVVLAPNGVKTNWVTDELPIHMPSYIEWAAAYWSSGAKKDLKMKWEQVLNELPRDRLRWLVVNIEALSSYQDDKHQGDLVPVLKQFCKSNRVLLVVDESTRIKKWSTNRTKATLALGKLSPYRRILSGMPVTQSPLDVYTPFFFLDPAILGFGSQYSFKNHFAILGGWNGKEIIGYQHMEELQRLVRGHSFRVLRDECADMPPKRFQKVTVQLVGKQRQFYDQMRDEMLAEYEGKQVTTSIVITQMLRLQQIVGGHVTWDDGRVEAVPGPNPKLEALLDLLEEETRKVVIWARFRPEIDLIAKALRGRYGEDAVVEFHGGVNDADRIVARQSFQNRESPVRFFVGQQGTGGIGITLSAASVVVYYSNTFSYEDRKQSEDRAEGLTQTQSTTIIDLVAQNTVDDKKIIPSLRTKQGFALQVTGDNWKEWI
jgi:hypothetical protein